jgi:hypothetical protein
MDKTNLNELYSQLKNLDKQTLSLIISQLLVDRVINYVEISQLYVNYLTKEDDKCRMIKAESSACLYQSIVLDKASDEYSRNIQRSLKFLNDYGNINVVDLNKKFGYNTSSNDD